MLLMGCFHIVRIKGQMEFIVPQVVRFLPVPEPGQFQPVLRLPISQIGQDKGAVRSFVLSHNLETQSFFIKGDTFLQIKYVEIVVIKRKFHGFSPCQT